MGMRLVFTAGSPMRCACSLPAPADIGQTGEEPWHVLADPEGNEFCLLRARLDPL